MSWQIQCKQHFLKHLYTLNNQLESEETLTWHEEVQMYYWDCMRVRGGDYNECWACMRVKRGAMFCCRMCIRVYESCMRVERGSVRVVWEVLWELYESWERFCESCMRVVERGYVRVVWERRSNIICIPRLYFRQNKMGHDQTWWETNMTSPHGVSDHI